MRIRKIARQMEVPQYFVFISYSFYFTGVNSFLSLDVLVLFYIVDVIV